MYTTDAEKAAAETIRICSEKDVLAEYLKDKGKEATSMMTLLFDQEYARKMEIINERKEAKAEGRAEGQNTIINLLNCLIGAGRLDEIQRVSSDASYRSQLMAEFGLA